jgi:hypothetical protein
LGLVLRQIRLRRGYSGQVAHNDTVALLLNAIGIIVDY